MTSGVTVLARCSVGRQRDAEVGEQRAPGLVVQEDVVGLDVAVDDAAGVRVRQRGRDVGEDGLGSLGREARRPRASPARACGPGCIA